MSEYKTKERRIISPSMERVRDTIFLLVGSFITAVAFAVFLAPNNIVPGGLSGISLILSKVSSLNTGVWMLLLNIPLFIISFWQLGFWFTARSLISTIMISIIIDYVSFPVIEIEKVTAALIGGAMFGTGLGFVFRSNTSTGGTDLIAKIIHVHFPALRTTALLLIVDFTVISIFAAMFDFKSAIYALISLFLSFKAVDTVLDGINISRNIYIISSKPEEIKRQIYAEIGRGVTELKAVGGFTGEDRIVLMCTVEKFSVAKIKQIVQSIDEKAFMLIDPVSEVVGHGFKGFNDDF